MLNTANAQFVLKTMNGINTANDDIACTLMNGELIYMTGVESDLVNDYLWNMKPMFQLLKAKRGETYADWQDPKVIFDRRVKGDQGPATYNPQEAILFFSSPENFGGAVSKNLKIYTVKKNVEVWDEPVLLPLCKDQYDYTHPFYDPEQKLLVFSSNRQGGQGKMDIWYTYKLDSGWTEPVNPGLMVNTTSNEIFPTIYNGDIYFASDVAGGKGGYDVLKALRTDQWKSSITLGEPINSEFDDISLFYLSDDKAFLTTNRPGGKGGDDIYVLERQSLPEEAHDFLAVLECRQRPYMNVAIFAVNEAGEIIFKEKSNENGKIDIKKLRLNQNYILQLIGVDASLYEHTILSIYDNAGNKLREIRFNASGFAKLELLPLSYIALNLLPLIDKSLLTLNIEGQLFDQKLGDVGKNEPVTILDEAGIPVAIAYTNPTGKFRFTQVEPRTDYTFQLSKETAAKNVLITDKGDKIFLPVLNAEIRYGRIAPGEAIELINEYNEKIVVSPKDLFVINRIYYEYNSARLTPESTGQLNQLKIIMERNPNFGLELRSHTDSRGNDDYNLKLSERRATSAIHYLMEAGFNRKRFKAVGMGETQLLNECDDGVECSEPEHSINRRTEIKLTKSQ